MLIFTNIWGLELVSDFPLLPSCRISFGDSEFGGFEKLDLQLARFFLDERTGGHPTTAACAILVLLELSKAKEIYKYEHGFYWNISIKTLN